METKGNTMDTKGDTMDAKGVAHSTQMSRAATHSPATLQLVLTG